MKRALSILLALLAAGCSWMDKGGQPRHSSDAPAWGDSSLYLGTFQGMAAYRYTGVIWPQTTVSTSVVMYSANTGEMLKWISMQDFEDIFVTRSKPEYGDWKP